MNRTEEQLLEDIKCSDTEAFRILFEKFQPVLFRYLMFRLSDEDVVHDIVQETFVRVWQHRVSINPHLPVVPYLFRIGGNLLKDHFKHAAVKNRFAERERMTAANTDGPDQQTEARLLQDEIGRIVHDDMPDRCREIFILSRVEGKSNQEIAEMLRLKIKSVENQLTLALKILRKKLRDRIR